jgi:hypothetical protein
MTPLHPVHPWLRSVIGSEPDTGIVMTAHIALTYECEDHLVATVALPIALLPIQNQENPIWQQRLEGMSNLEARYAQYLFNL